MNYFIIPGLERFKNRNFTNFRNKVIDIACDVNDLKLEDFNSKKRNRNIVDARRMVSFILRKSIYEPTLEKIGEIVGKDHSMVVHYINTHEQIYNTDLNYKKKFNLIYIRLDKFELRFNLKSH